MARARTGLALAALLAAAGMAVRPGGGLELVDHGRRPLERLVPEDVRPGEELLWHGEWRQSAPGTVFLGAEVRDLEGVSLRLDGREPRLGPLPADSFLGALDLMGGPAPLEVRARVSGPRPSLRLAVGEELPRLEPLSGSRVTAPGPLHSWRLLCSRAWLVLSAMILIAIAPRRVRAAVLGAAAALLALEGLLRITGVRPRPRVPGTVLVDYDFGPGRFVRYMGVHPTTVREFLVGVAWNQEGFRDGTFGAGGRPLRVGVVGDSFVAAHEVDLAETFHQRLEQRWPEVELLALARGGTGPVQQLEFLRSALDRHAVDGLVWCVFAGNDVADCSPPLAAARRRWVEEVLYGRILPARVAWLRGMEATHSRALAVLADRLTPLFESCLPLLPGGPAAHELVGPAADVYRADHGSDEPLWQAAWSALEGALREGRDLARARGVPLVVVHLPDEGWPLPGAGRARELDRSLPGRRLAELCGRLELELVDLEDAFGGDGDLFWRHDGHWNPAGHARATETLGRELEQRGWPEGLRR